jgi:predicted metal-dependent HD superfamily phosphohydrolase
MIEEFLTQYLPKAYTYHSLDHIKDVVKQVALIAKKEKVKQADMLDLQLAAWLHDIGYIWEPKRHEEKGAEYATVLLKAFDFPTPKIQKITGMIMATKIPQTPKNILEQIICDADLDYLGRPDYEKNSQLLLQELSLAKQISALDWLHIQDGFLSKHQYFTKTSNASRNKLKLKVAASIQSQIKIQSNGRSRT